MQCASTLSMGIDIDHSSSNPGDETGDESNSDVEIVDPEQDRAEEEATKQRKKAGIPEMDGDTVPSVIATKMMSLDFCFLNTNNAIGCALRSGYLQTITKKTILALKARVFGILRFRTPQFNACPMDEWSFMFAMMPTWISQNVLE